MGDKPKRKNMSVFNHRCIRFDVPGDLVPQRFAGDNGDFFTDSLVGVEVECQSSVVLLDDQLGSLLDGLGANAALHDHKTKHGDERDRLWCRLTQVSRKLWHLGKQSVTKADFRIFFYPNIYLMLKIPTDETNKTYHFERRYRTSCQKL